MQSNHNRHTQKSWSTILLLAIISLFSCIIGVVLGAGGFWYYGQMIGTTIGITMPEPELPVISPKTGSNSPVGDGFFLIVGGRFTKIPEFSSDSQIDFSLLPSVDGKEPVFAIKGSNYPLGRLRLSG